MCWDRITGCLNAVFPVGLSEFLIQYEDSLHHRGHWHNLTEAPGTRTTASLQLSPYAHYIFRVLALNAVGLSRPSAPSGMYKTEPAGEYAHGCLAQRRTTPTHTAAAVVTGRTGAHPLQCCARSKTSLSVLGEIY